MTTANVAIHTGSCRHDMGRAFSCVCEYVSGCASVRAVKRKRLELSTPTSAEIQPMEGPRRALTRRSKRVRMGERRVGLHVDMSAHFSS